MIGQEIAPKRPERTQTRIRFLIPHWEIQIDGRPGQQGIPTHHSCSTLHFLWRPLKSCRVHTHQAYSPHVTHGSRSLQGRPTIHPLLTNP